MKLAGGSSDDRNKIIAVAAFVALAGVLLYVELNPGSGATNPAPVPAESVAGEPATGFSGAAGVHRIECRNRRMPPSVWGRPSARLDPTLHMDSMLVSERVEYSGVGRNIFSPNSAPPVVIQKPIAPARPMATANVAPPVPMGPPRPPPIDLTFFGTEDANGKRQAILLHQDTVYTAQVGDVVLRRYRIISIDAKSMQVEDMQNNNRQTLPLLAN